MFVRLTRNELCNPLPWLDLEGPTQQTYFLACLWRVSRLGLLRGWHRSMDWGTTANKKTKRRWATLLHPYCRCNMTGRLLLQNFPPWHNVPSVSRQNEPPFSVLSGVCHSCKTSNWHKGQMGKGKPPLLVFSWFVFKESGSHNRKTRIF